MNALDRALESFGERMNPILVRDVRRAMKGQIFVVAFMSVLLFAFLGTLLVLLGVWRQARGEATALDEVTAEFAVNGSSLPAQLLFGGLFFLLSVAVTGIVPLLAFFSMSAERDESTLDLLSLASLRPGAIVRGKLFALALQALLFYAAITPFIATCFLMRGLSLEVFLASMGMSVLFCAGLTSLGLLLSCLKLPKVGRLGLLILFGFLAYGMNMALVFGAGTTAQNPSLLADTDFRAACGIFGGFAVLMTAFSLAFSPGQLAHLEENRTTGPRLATTAAVVFFLFGCLVLRSLGVNSEIRFMFIWFSFYLLTIPLALFVSEHEFLGRRVGMGLRRYGPLAVLAAPWLPGGGRGMIFALLHLAVMFFGGPYLDPMWSGSIFGSTGAGSIGGGVMGTPLTLPALGYTHTIIGLQVTVLYLLLFLGLGPALFSRWTRRPIPRAFSGLSVPLLAFAAFLVVTLLRATDLQSGSPEYHWANPLMVPEWVFQAPGTQVFRPALSILYLLVPVVLLLNAKRMVWGVFEVWRAANKPKVRTLPEAAEGAGA